MTLSLKEVLYNKFNIAITPTIANQITYMTEQWELKRTHHLCLNTSLLGIDNIFFTAGDQQHLFEICNISKEEFKSIVHKVNSIDTTRIVTSDPYNIFITWLAHLTYNSKLPDKSKDILTITLFKLLHYKFFTSLVNHNFPYKANESIMRATIDNLSGKFDIKIKETSTWKLLIEAKSKDVIDKNSVHYKTIKTYSPDYKILYIISDIQTRLRTKIKLITREYYLNKDKDNKITSYGLVEDIDGEKSIKSIVGSFDTMKSSIINKSMNTQNFLNHNYIKIVISLNKNLRPELLRSFLIWFSNRSIQQYKNHLLDHVEGKDDGMLYIGNNILISNIIQKTYRLCILDKIDLASKLTVLEKTRNLYRTSRINDRDILIIKNSVENIINEFGIVKRESTITSLKIGFITYIMLLSFDYI